MIPSVRVFEHVTRVTPLGLRFWDEVSGSVISDGLIVTAYSPNNPERRIPALANRAGVYFLQNLPGLYDAEIGKGDAVYWANLLVQKSFVIEVIGTDRRFQPFSFTANLPARDFFTLPCLPPASPPSSPPEPPPFVPLYSAPTRAVPGAMAVLRAELFDPIANTTAAWAGIEARLDGQVVRGFADQQGRLALIFPYPEPAPPSLGSPPAGNRPSIFAPKWVVQLRAFYSPSLASAAIPDLCKIFQQPPATLLLKLSQPTSLAEATLQFGKELVINSESQSVLFITT